MRKRGEALGKKKIDRYEERVVATLSGQPGR
jgi:hypothetical protein